MSEKKGKYTFDYIHNRNEVYIRLTDSSVNECDTFDTIKSIVSQVKSEYNVKDKNIFLTYEILDNI